MMAYHRSYGATYRSHSRKVLTNRRFSPYTSSNLCLVQSRSHRGRSNYRRGCIVNRGCQRLRRWNCILRRRNLSYV
ncbi:hypothetical protein BIW11_10394, partial [Tropilaelaps mercedesae]